MAAPPGAGAADLRWAEKRATLTLIADRVVRPVIQSNRETLVVSFSKWLSTQGQSLEALLDLPLNEAEEVAGSLLRCGQ